MAADDNKLALLFRSPSAIPVRVGFLPAAWKKHREALDEIVGRYPDIAGETCGERDYDTIDAHYAEGEKTDAWGCGWSNIREGMAAIATVHPLQTRADVRAMKAPETDIGLPHGFMYLRLADLRGFEELMVDFAEEPPELQMLIDVVLDYNVRQMRLLREEGMSRDAGQIVSFGDDLGMQKSLPMSPEKWRRYLKPCFETLYKPFVDAGHHVYMHTDGHIIPIIPDLKDCGVSIVNPQIRANGLDRLVEVCKGSICVDLDLDRQMFPFCSPADIDDHVREAVMKLGAPEGGLWLTAEVGEDVPLENVDAIFAALRKYRTYFS